eukprot:6635093-Karenia_brevis.AAC.1
MAVWITLIPAANAVELVVPTIPLNNAQFVGAPNAVIIEISILVNKKRSALPDGTAQCGTCPCCFAMPIVDTCRHIPSIGRNCNTDWSQ